MPAYDFRCEKCLLMFERQIPRVDGVVSSVVIMCPACVSVPMTRLFPAPSRIIMGAT
jgi:putative FmdB family regulatory protein